MSQPTPCLPTPRRILVALAVVAVLLTAALPAAAAPLQEGQRGRATVQAPAIGAWSLTALWQELLERILDPAPTTAATTAATTVPRPEGPVSSDPLVLAASDDGSKEIGPSLDPNGLK